MLRTRSNLVSGGTGVGNGKGEWEYLGFYCPPENGIHPYLVNKLTS